MFLVAEKKKTSELDDISEESKDACVGISFLVKKLYGFSFACFFMSVLAENKIFNHIHQVESGKFQAIAK